MSALDRILRGIIGLTGVFQVLLGVVFWTGHGLRFVPAHMLAGILFVLALWVLASRAALAGAGWRAAAPTAVWGAIVLVLGMTQTRILPGEYHWVIRVLHVLVGFAAMGFAGRLTQAMRRARLHSSPGRLEASAV